MPMKKVDVLILGCTNYGLLKKEIKKILGAKIKIIAQEDLLPKKLKIYLKHHTEIREKLSKNKTIKLFVTKINPRYKKLALSWFGEVNINRAVI